MGELHIGGYRDFISKISYFLKFITHNSMRYRERKLHIYAFRVDIYVSKRQIVIITYLENLKPK